MSEERGVRRVVMNPVLWAMIYGALIACGIYALWRIPVEVLPRFDFPQISVVTHAPGATASEMEALIVWPLEGQILALQDLVSVRTIMGNGSVETDVRFREGSNAALDLQAVNGAIDRARGQIPASAQPLAEIMGNSINEVADYTLAIATGVAPAAVQRTVLADIAPALRALPGVQRVDVYGSGDEALWIQPDLAALRRNDVAVTAITQAVKDQVVLSPAGYTRQGHQDVLIEARRLPLHIAQLQRVPIPGPNGPIPLRDLARIVRAAMPTRNAVALDGRPSVALTVFKQPDASTRPVTLAVATTLNATRGQLPAAVRWVRIYSQGHIVHLVGADLGRNLLIGAVLAIAILVWVLGAGRGIAVLALSIPLSLLLAVAALYALGESLNLMTLGALTVAVGLLADDAILILESIHHCWEQGDPLWPGIWRGVRTIAIPGITGTLTNVSIYLPLLFVGGLAGLFFIPFALAMASALLASLLVSLTLIPLGLGFAQARPKATATAGARALERLRRINERLFDWVVRRPRLSLALTFLLLLLSLAGLAWVPLDFLPVPNEGTLLDSFSLPPGSSLAETQAAVQSMTRRLLADPVVAHVFARIGSAASTMYTEPATAGEMQIALKSGVNVNSLDRIGRRLQKETRLPGVQLALDTPTVERVGESLSGLPQPFAIDLFGGNIGILRQLSQRITSRLRSIPALTDIFNDDAYPVTELQMTPRPQALAAYHLTLPEWYAQVDPLLNGEVLARVPEGNVPLELYIRLADAPQKSLAALAALPIHGSAWTPLGELATLDLVVTPNQIRHISGARALEIAATPTGPLGGNVAAAKRALAGLPLPAGYRMEFGGLFPQLEHAVAALAAAGVAALLLMIGILILQFDGWLIPGLLLLEIPLALMGGALALVVSGVGLNATGLIAFLTLIGIGLRHGIVLLDRTRKNETAGMPLEEAVREAIHVRFRPIVLTAVTAALGMLPTALGLGQGAAPEQGLAIVILGGLIWSAARSTNLIPALYLHWRRGQLAKAAPS
ncbi:MAG TPA: efflux RND transporter permease subunit [Steroidobacteraceae bacterium]|nr:efflux RND transporter permease subunit [Steroidobacteraceae bacterium]